MMTNSSERIDLNRVKRDNFRAINDVRYLYLALNDVVEFERAVLAGDSQYPLKPSDQVNSATGPRLK